VSCRGGLASKARRPPPSAATMPGVLEQPRMELAVKGATSHRPSPPPRCHVRLPRPSTVRRQNHLPGAAAPSTHPHAVT
jgi:hypothetical protein